MKLKLIFLLLASCVFAQQEDTFSYKYQITYKYTYKYDSLDLNKTRSENMLLKVGDSISTFMSLGKSKLDSLVLKAEEYDKKNLPAKLLLTPANLANTHSNINYKIVKNYPKKGVITHNEEWYKNNYAYKETLPKNWVLINKTDTINNIKVKKAKINYRGRKFIAYYAEEIPISEGPYKFTGLPGLIVKLYDSEHLFDFELLNIIQINSTEHIQIVSPYILNNVSREEFLMAKRNFRKNPQELIDRFGSENSKRLKDNVNRENLFIEKD